MTNKEVTEINCKIYVRLKDYLVTLFYNFVVYTARSNNQQVE